MTERKLATIQKIVSISPIEGADAIEVARVLNWDIVVKKGEFTVDQLAVYFEIDSFIPTAFAPFLTKSGHFPKTYNGVEGEKLRTIRLRGALSQGLLLPLSTIGTVEPIGNEQFIRINTTYDTFAGTQNGDLPDNK